MNVRIFWVRAMKCMCAQTRLRFILSSERVLGGMKFEPMLTPREKSPLPENFPRGGSNPRRCGQRAQTLPTSYSGPLPGRVIPVIHNWYSSDYPARRLATKDRTVKGSLRRMRPKNEHEEIFFNDVSNDRTESLSSKNI